MWRIPKVAGSYDRARSSQDTVERLLARKARYGITRVADITGLDNLGIPVHCAVRPRSRSTTSVHAGKGLTASDSLAGALAEAIELDCAERFHPESVVRGSHRRLRADHSMFRPTLGLPDRLQLPDELELEWVWVRDLLSGCASPLLLPLELVRQGVGDAPGALFDVRLSDGLASGNVLEEAISHAIDELIERDAVSQFMFQAKYCRHDVRGHYRAISLDSLPPVPGDLVERIRRADRRIDLLDATSDVGMPVVICSISGAHGMGAAHHSERAVIRAITEAAQCSTVNIQGAREDLDPRQRDPRTHERSSGLDLERASQIMRDPFLPRCDLQDLPSRAHDFIDQDLAVSLELLRVAGIHHAFVCDVSDQHCDEFRAVRVVIPELELARLDTLGPRRLRHLLGGGHRGRRTVHGAR